MREIIGIKDMIAIELDGSEERRHARLDLDNVEYIFAGPINMG